MSAVVVVDGEAVEIPQIAEAVGLFDAAYLQTFPAGGDAGDHEDAIREGVTAVLLHAEAAYAAVWQQLLDDIADGAIVTSPQPREAA